MYDITIPRALYENIPVSRDEGFRVGPIWSYGENVLSLTSAEN